MKRILSMLLCLALVIGFIPVFTMPAQAATTATKATSIAAGDQVIFVAKGKNVAMGSQNGSYRSAVSNITISNNKLTVTDSMEILTVAAGSEEGSFAFKDESGKYLSWSSGNSCAQNASINKNSSWKVNFSTGKVSNAADSTRNLQYNASSPRFAAYSSNQTVLEIYKLDPVCQHTSWTWTIGASSHSKVCSACKETFFTCNKVISYDVTETQHTPECTCGYVGTAVDHEFGDYTPVDGGHNRACEVCEYTEATAPCVDDGTGKCGTCGTLMGCDHDWKAAHNETQHFEVCSKCNGTRNEEDHAFESSFVDDTHTDACDCGYAVTEKHVLTNGKCSCGFALKAEATGGYVLVTDASQLAAGDKVIIVAKDYAYALSTSQGNNNRGQASVTKSGNAVTIGSDVQVLELKAGKTAGTLAFYTGSGYLYAASSSNNHLKTETTLSNNSSWKITIASDGTATIVAQGSNTRNTMQYNQTSSLFACYGSASQKALCIYKLVENTTKVNVFQADTRLKDTLNLAYHFTVKTTDNVVKAGALIRIGDKTYNYIATAGNGYYTVEVSGIYAQSIDELVYIKPYAEFANGLVYGTEKSTSVLKCLEYMYNNEEETAETKAVIKDLLNYANAARNYFVAEGKMSAPAQAFNEVLAEADRVLAWNEEFRADKAEVEEKTGAFVPVPGTVIAGIQEALRLRFEFNDANVAGFVYWNEEDYAANAGNHTKDTGTITFVANGAVAKGYIENIFAFEMYENFFIRAYNAEGELSETYTTSIAAYITAEMDENEDNAAYVELCKAMLIYGNTAMNSDAIVKG